jgi:hypothetical protein
MIWTKSNSNNERKYVWNDLRVPDSYIINEIPDYSYTEEYVISVDLTNIFDNF